MTGAGLIAVPSIVTEEGETKWSTMFSVTGW
jgi:hypothetical protein